MIYNNNVMLIIKGYRSFD